MRALSPIRSPSPINRPRITFNYPPSPLKQLTPNVQNASPMAPQKNQTITVQTSQIKNQKTNAEFQKCVHCLRMATYKSAKQGHKYCSSCAINQMRMGTQVVRIQLKQQKFYKEYQHKFDKQNNHFSSPDKIVSSRQHSCNQWKQNTKSTVQNTQAELQILTKQAKEIKFDMETLLQKLQNKPFASQGIKNIYREKKLGLKKHYQKIKAAIKSSIQKDLQQLEKREQLSLQCLQNVKGDLQKGINLLSNVRQKSQSNKKGYPSAVENNSAESLFNETKSIVFGATQKRKRASQIVTQLAAYQQGSDSQSDSLNVRVTQQQIQQAKRQLYEPQNYTLLDGKSRKGETLFSFQRKFK